MTKCFSSSLGRFGGISRVENCTLHSEMVSLRFPVDKSRSLKWCGLTSRHPSFSSLPSSYLPSRCCGISSWKVREILVREMFGLGWFEGNT